jgi:hypothetical protein
METKELIERNKKSIDELFVRISKSKIPIERFVIIEKFKEPSLDMCKDLIDDEQNENVVPDDELFHFLEIAFKSTDDSPLADR